jgi:hypothetical protein
MGVESGAAGATHANEIDVADFEMTVRPTGASTITAALTSAGNTSDIEDIKTTLAARTILVAVDFSGLLLMSTAYGLVVVIFCTIPTASFCKTPQSLV